jgi:hypothetical protein
MRPLARWTIGPTTKNGFECLQRSIASFTAFYDVDVVICHNCAKTDLGDIKFPLHDQSQYLQSNPKPIGVAWKLYPPRMDITRHELCIDNDIVINEPIPQIGYFLDHDCTLLLEDLGRTYGRFERYIPPHYQINSGIYGMPPGFDLDKYFQFYSKEWEINAVGDYAASKTFDEQGLVALALLDYKNFVIIPSTTINNCERRLYEGAGYHFVGLNRQRYHGPYQLYKHKQLRTHL